MMVLSKTEYITILEAAKKNLIAGTSISIAVSKLQEEKKLKFVPSQTLAFYKARSQQ